MASNWQPPESDFDWQPPADDFNPFGSIGSGRYIEEQAAQMPELGQFMADQEAQDTAYRTAFRGLSSPFVLGIDMANAVPNLINKGINAISPGSAGYLPMGADYQRAALERMGVDPEPKSTGERMATAALSAVTGGGLARGLGGSIAQSLPNFGGAISRMGAPPISAAAAGATSVAAADTAKEMGAGPYGQMAAGIAGGMAGGTGVSILGATGRGIHGALKPMAQSGQEEIAGRVLRRQASAPNTAIARAQDGRYSQQILPGSNPTLAEVTQDPSIGFLQRALKSTDSAKAAGVSDLNDYRITEIDSAIRKTLDRVNAVPKNGKADVIEKLDGLKKQAVSTFEEAMQANGRSTGSHVIDVSPITTRIDDLLAKHYGKTNIEGILNKITAGLDKEPPRGAVKHSFQQVWNMRQELDDAIYENWKNSDKSTKQDLARIGEDLRAAMNQALVDSAPEFKPFLRLYSRSQKGIDRLKLGRELLDKTQNAGRNIAEGENMYGDRAISGAKLENLRPDIIESGRLGKLTKAQQRAFLAAIEEKRRSNILTNNVAQIGSPTAPYITAGKMISDDIVGGILGDRTGKANITRSVLENYLARPLSFATRSNEPEIMRLVGRGLRDPTYGSKLMEKGQVRPEITMRGVFEERLKQGLLGEFARRLAQ